MNPLTPTSYMMFIPNLGIAELTVIFVIVLILFGPGKLPSVFRALGDGVRQFKKASSEDPTPERLDEQSSH